MYSLGRPLDGCSSYEKNLWENPMKSTWEKPKKEVPGKSPKRRYLGKTHRGRPRG